MTLRDKLTHPDCIPMVNGVYAEEWGETQDEDFFIGYNDDGNDGYIHIPSESLDKDYTGKYQFSIDRTVITLQRATPFLP